MGKDCAGSEVTGWLEADDFSVHGSQEISVS